MKIIIKIGSSCIIKDNQINYATIKNLINNISQLINDNKQVFLISSGGISIGNFLDKKLLNLEEKNVNLFNLGWSYLTKLYYEACIENNIYPLLRTITKENFQQTFEYIKNINIKFLPIINEDDFLNQNDPYYDNDHLTYEISKILNPDVVIFLTSIDGVLTEENGTLIKKLNINSQFNPFNKTQVGRGGIESKVNYANEIFLNKAKVFIANGLKKDIILDITNNKESYTEIC